MKTLKKLFSVSAIVALLGTLAPMYAFGATYTDELEDAYAYARANGVTTKNTIDEADMYGSLTRIAMAKMIANYATTVLGLEADTSRNCTFSDVTAALDAEYGNGVTNACQLGLMGIDDNGNVKATFDPKGTVTRAQFATALSRAISQAEDGEAIANGNPYYRTHIAYLNGKGIVKSEAEYDVNSVEKRGYVMLMMMRADKNYTPSEGCTTEQIVACALEDDTAACLAACSGNEEPEEEDLPGYATVSTKAAAAQTVALNAVDKKIGTVTLKAGENDTTVTNIEITKSGLGAAKDVANIQLMKDGEYVTNQGQLNGNNVAKLRFRPSVTIKAGKTETFDVVVSMAGSGKATPNGQHEFSVTSVTVVNGSFGGTPAKLGSLTTTNYLVPEMTVKSVATPANLSAGDEDVEIASIELRSADANATVNSITLTSNKDELYKAFANVKAYINDEEIGTVKVNDETIVINGLEKKIEKGKTVTISLKGDVVYVGETINGLTLKIETNHVNAVEDNTQEKMASNGDKISAGLSIEGVDLTIERNITKEQTAALGEEAILMDMNVKSAGDLEITSFYVDFGTIDFTAFEDNKVTLYVDGVDYDLTADKTFSDKYDSFTVSANSSVRVYIAGDVKSEANAPQTVKPITFGITKVKSDNKEIDVTTSNVYAAGHSTKITKGSYTTVRPSTMPTNKTVIAGEESEVLFFNLKASTENLVLKNVVIKSNLVFSDFASEVSLLRDGKVVKTFNKADDLSGKNITFDKLTVNLTKDTTVPFTVKVKVKGDDVTDLGTTFNVDLNSTKVVRAADTTADVSNGTTIVGNTYSISSVTPAIKVVTKADENVTVKFTNTSSYELNLKTVTFDITRAKDTEWTGRIKFLDAIGGQNVATNTVSLGGGAAASAGEFTFELDDDYTYNFAPNVLTATQKTGTSKTTCTPTVTKTTIDGVDYTDTTCGVTPVHAVITGKVTTLGSDVAAGTQFGSTKYYYLEAATAGSNVVVTLVHSGEAATDVTSAPDLDGLTEETLVTTGYAEVKGVATWTLTDTTDYAFALNAGKTGLVATENTASTVALGAARTINNVSFTCTKAGVAGTAGDVAVNATIPGTVTVTFDTTNNVAAGQDITRVVELLSSNYAIETADYVFTVKGLSYTYTDDDNHTSSVISETYNEK